MNLFLLLLLNSVVISSLENCLRYRSRCENNAPCAFHLRKYIVDCLSNNGSNGGCCRTAQRLRSSFPTACECPSGKSVDRCEQIRVLFNFTHCKDSLSLQINKIDISDEIGFFALEPSQEDLFITATAQNLSTALANSSAVHEFPSPELALRRSTRSPMADKIRTWKKELSGVLQGTARVGNFDGVSCNHALYQVCLKHVSCRQLWNIFRSSCRTDASNQCIMSNREDCWQSYEGLSWTGLGNCECFNETLNDSDCHFIRLQTNYNKCIYEIYRSSKIPPSLFHSLSQKSWPNQNERAPQPHYSEDYYRKSTPNPRLAVTERLARPPTPGRPAVGYNSSPSVEPLVRKNEPANTEVAAPRKIGNLWPHPGERVGSYNVTSAVSTYRLLPKNISSYDSRQTQLQAASERGGVFANPTRSSPTKSQSSRTESIAKYRQQQNMHKLEREKERHEQSHYKTEKPATFETADLSGRSLEKGRGYAPKVSREPLTTVREKNNEFNQKTVPYPSSGVDQRLHENFVRKDGDFSDSSRTFGWNTPDSSQKVKPKQDPSNPGSYRTEGPDSATRQGFSNSHRTLTNKNDSISDQYHSSKTVKQQHGFVQRRDDQRSKYEHQPKVFGNSMATVSPTSTVPALSTQTATTWSTTLSVDRGVTTGATTVKPSSATPNITRGRFSSSHQQRTVQSPSRFEQKSSLTSTCVSAYSRCQQSDTCSWHLSEVKIRCQHQCVRQNCSEAVQRFIQYVNRKLAESLMFCHCNLSDQLCLEYQQLLYPRCLYSDREVGPLTCTEAVNKCGEDPQCRLKWSKFFQYCPVRNGYCLMTNFDDCIQALIAIRGTYLEYPCYCPQNDRHCKKYQSSMLPSNPCVERSMIEYSRLSSGDFLSSTTAPEFLGEHQAKSAPKTPLDPRDQSHSIQEITPSRKHYYESGTTTGAPIHSMIGMEMNSFVNSSGRDIGWNLSPGQTVDAGNNMKHKGDDNRQLSSPRIVGTSFLTPSQREGRIKQPNILVPPRTTQQNNEENYDASTSSRVSSQGNRNLASKVNSFATTTYRPYVIHSGSSESGCTVKDRSGNYVTHRKGSVIRWYEDWTEQCSKWCQCDDNEKLICYELNCLEGGNCSIGSTKLGYGDRIYLKSRGSCTCVSGEFICQRPKDFHKLEKGLYLLVGFSRSEVDLLRKSIPKANLSYAGFLSNDIRRDIEHHLQIALEELIPEANEKNQKTVCRVSMKDEINKDIDKEKNIIFHVEWFGLNPFRKENFSRWHTGRAEKVCSSYVRQLAEDISMNRAVSYQLVLSTIKQIKAVDSLDSIVASSASALCSQILELLLLLSFLALLQLN